MEAFYAGPRRVLHGDDIAGITSIYGGYSIAEASWVHGTAVKVELPESIESMRRFGFFTRLIGKPNTQNWFHFAIPTPVIVNDDRKVVGPCMLRFQTGGANAVVRDVHIYDGEVRVAAHDSVNLSGSQPFTPLRRGACAGGACGASGSRSASRTEAARPLSERST